MQQQLTLYSTQQIAKPYKLLVHPLTNSTYILPFFRKLFIDLCGRKLSRSIEHPCRSGERLFLLFGFTHNFKNIYNNFVNRKRMNLPTCGHESIMGSSCVALFAHISKLYGLEETNTLKIAFSLKKASLNPGSIVKTSPQHALSKRSLLLV